MTRLTQDIAEQNISAGGKLWQQGIAYVHYIGQIRLIFLRRQRAALDDIIQLFGKQWIGKVAKVFLEEHGGEMRVAEGLQGHSMA